MNGDPTASDFQIPTSGVAIEFCESTSAQFPTALKIAQAAPTYATVIRGKKSWYLAAWPESGFAEATSLAQPLSTLRNRRCYCDGVKVPWDELFGFTWCASQRQSAYRPAAYCFGKDDNRINCWGCKQARMDWTEWAQWFSYGQFDKGGFLSRGRVTWIFDKERIRHELDTNLHRFRYCPHMRRKLVDAALAALPDQIMVTDGGAWKFSRTYEQTPGSIIVKEREQSFDGHVFETEYFADGVRPRTLEALAEVLRKAFADAQVTDVDVPAILR